MGSNGDSVYDKGALPPLAAGNVPPAIALPLIHHWSRIVTPGGNDGAVSGSTIVILNVNVSESLAEVLLSESVTVYVYVLALCVAVGVPDKIRVELLKLRPSGSLGDSEYDNGGLPPVAAGSANGLMVRS